MRVIQTMTYKASASCCISVLVGNVIKNNCVLNKCLTNGKSRTPISYNRMDNHRCGTTKKVKVAGTGADRITKLKQQMQYC